MSSRKPVPSKAIGITIVVLREPALARSAASAWARMEAARALSVSMMRAPSCPATPAMSARSANSATPVWLASKIACGAIGLAVVPVLAGLLTLAGGRLPWALPAAASLAFGAAMFFAPDFVTKVNAAEKRADFRHALTSYLDLVSLERGAGAAPTEALEAAAGIGGGWAFERISAALDEARKAGLAPWAGLADRRTE